MIRSSIDQPELAGRRRLVPSVAPRLAVVAAQIQQDPRPTWELLGPDRFWANSPAELSATAPVPTESLQVSSHEMLRLMSGKWFEAF